MLLNQFINKIKILNCWQYNTNKMLITKIFNQKINLSTICTSFKVKLLIQNINNNKPKSNLSLTTNINYYMSRRFNKNKTQQLQPQSPYLTSNAPSNQMIDFQSLPINQKIRVLRQSIFQYIDKKQDTSQLSDIMEKFSFILIDHQKIKDGLIQYSKIVNKMKSLPVFKTSPNLHYALSQYRYFLIRTGRIQEAIVIQQNCYNILRKAGQKQNPAIASELSILGILHFTNKNQVQARNNLQAQLKMNIKLCDQNFIQVIDCKNNLAILDFVSGKYENAQQIFYKNAQISKRILKSNKKKKQKLYAKHFSYLQAIYQLKMTQAKNDIDKKVLKNQIHNCIEQMRQIMKQNSKTLNDFHLYYETIAQHFLEVGKYQLSIKFINKALAINQKKIAEPLTDGGPYQTSNSISKELKILGRAQQKQKLYQQAFNSYTKSMTRYKKDILSQQGKQLISLQAVDDYIECCKCLFRLQFIPDNSSKKPFQQAYKFMENLLLTWNDIIKNIWNLPNRFIFIPYEINIEIGIKLLQFNEVDGAMQYFNVCIEQIQTNKGLLCIKSKKNMSELNQMLKKVIKNLAKQMKQRVFQLQKVSQKLDNYSKP